MDKKQETIDTLWRFTLAIAVAITVMYVPWDAMAVANVDGSDMSLTRVLCNIVGWITGPLGKAICTLFIIVIGVGALMGKVSWGVAVIVGVGVGVVFGATTIVQALGGDGKGTTCDSGTYNNQGFGGG